MEDSLLWPLIVAVFGTIVSWTAWRRLDSVWQAPRNPYEVYMLGQVLAGPIAWVIFLIIALR